MRSEWKKVKLGDVVKLITKGTTPSTFGFNFQNEGVNFIKSESLSYDGVIDIKKFAKISEIAHKKLKRSQIQENDILFSMAGIYLGKSGMIAKELLPANTNQAVAIIRINSGIAIPMFVWNVLRQKEIIAYVNGIPSQSAQPNINFEEIKSIEFSLPPLPVQQSIAQILSSFDDKIELLREQSNTLEALAQTLFKRWFVDFEFPDDDGMPYKSSGGKMVESELGLIPDGWRVGTLGEVSTKVFSGGTPDTQNGLFWGGKFMWLSSGETRNRYVLETEKSITEAGIQGSSTRQAKVGDILIATAGQGHTRGQTSLCLCDMYINQSVIAVRNENIRTNASYYFHNIVSRYDELRGLSEGNSIRGSITTKMIGGINVLVPSEELLLNFSDTINPTQQKLIQNYQELKTLTAMRELLLPRLINGLIEL